MMLSETVSIFIQLHIADKRNSFHFSIWIFGKGRLFPRFQNVLAYHCIGKKITGYRSNMKNSAGNDNE